jgi:hypothetical protein
MVSATTFGQWSGFAATCSDPVMRAAAEDSPAALLQGSISGKVIVPGNAAESLLVRRISGEDGVRMPPIGQPLSDSEIALIREWIDQGARIPETLLTAQPASPQHWAYVKPVRPALPPVKDTAWSRNPIDRFVLARSEKEGLKPSPEAAKETLIRRVSLDLVGLPPTPAEVAAFVNDTRPDAYERLVDRLLASPRYGERWATSWLDLARYGDSDGLRDDKQRVAWPYRDWVIKAFNQNMRFDRFTIEQLAGDMLPDCPMPHGIQVYENCGLRVISPSVQPGMKSTTPVKMSELLDWLGV